MKARLRKTLAFLADTFWLVPAVMTAGGLVLALVMVEIDRRGLVPQWVLDAAWLYNGGGTGARTLLGAIASSTIGVASTVFSITIAALSLAAGQMGPRLLRNFTKDRGNQVTLGAFLGTFSYALMVLRTVRTQEEGAFVPHLSLTMGVALGFVCVATLIFFVGHMAGRINVDTVIALVSRDVTRVFARIAVEAPQVAPPPLSFWRGADVVRDERRGYLQQLDAPGLAGWAADQGVALRLLVRPGDYVFPGAPVALVVPPVEGAAAAVRAATALSAQRDSGDDIEYAIRQLVEVAVRALSPGINDPYTAVSVLDRLGAALCELAPLNLPNGVVRHGGAVVLVVPNVDYDGLVDAMLHMIRQNGAASAAVMIRMLDVLTAVASCEREPSRRATLRRHADLVLDAAGRAIPIPADVDDVARRHAGFRATIDSGPADVPCRLGSVVSPGDGLPGRPGPG